MRRSKNGEQSPFRGPPRWSICAFRIHDFRPRLSTEWYSLTLPSIPCRILHRRILLSCCPSNHASDIFSAGRLPHWNIWIVSWIQGNDWLNSALLSSGEWLLRIDGSKRKFLHWPIPPDSLEKRLLLSKALLSALLNLLDHRFHLRTAKWNSGKFRKISTKSQEAYLVSIILRQVRPTRVVDAGRFSSKLEEKSWNELERLPVPSSGLTSTGTHSS